MKKFFVTNMLHKSLKTLDYTLDELKADMAHFNVDSPHKLNTAQFDARISKTLAEASRFVEQFKQGLAALEKLKGSDLSMPCMLLKRHYLVLTALGFKKYTIRSYDKGWKPGQMIYFHDQTFFLRVKIKSITPTDKGKFRYDFEPLRRKQ